MAETLKPDICVIGGGAAGLSVAAAAAAFGVPVVLIERDKMGGDCLNTGCVPSKALLAAAKRAAVITNGAAFGVTAQAVKIDFAKVHDHVQRVIAEIAPINSAERFGGLGVRVIKGHAKFKDRKTVVVGDIEIRARRFVIATGSTPALPPIPGLDKGRYLTNESVFSLAYRPDSLIVIGAGPIGLELAQAFRRLGSAVTVLEAAAPLAKDDPECAAIVLDQLDRDGVVIHSGVTVTRVEHGIDSVAVTFSGAGGEQTVEGQYLLVAAGRKPTVDGLDLEAAGIRYDRAGIAVNKRLKTRNRRVYAIGDCAAGQLQFTHAANYHAGLVIRNALFRLPVKVNNDRVPWVTYTDPELAQTGITEAQARARKLKFRILRWPYHDNDRAVAERETHGHIKVIVSTRGKILGATIVGAQAGELIAMWALGDCARSQRPRSHRRRAALSDAVGNRQTRSHRLFHAEFDQPLGAAHHSLAANLRLRIIWNRKPRQRASLSRRAAPRPTLRARIGLSGKLLFLTILFVMVAEILIYVPSIANFRLNWLNDRLAAAHTAALVLDAAPSGMVPESPRQADPLQHRRPCRRDEDGDAAPPAGRERCAVADRAGHRHARRVVVACHRRCIRYDVFIRAQRRDAGGRSSADGGRPIHRNRSRRSAAAQGDADLLGEHPAAVAGDLRHHRDAGVLRAALSAGAADGTDHRRT